MSDEKLLRPWAPGEPWISPGIEDVLPLSAVADPYVPPPSPDEPHDFIERGLSIEPGWCRCSRHRIDPIHSARRAATEPRWHEIATEGLPLDDLDVVTWSPEMGSLVSFGRVIVTEDDDGNPVREWRDDHGESPDWTATWWHPTPAPPVLVLDGNEIRRATDRAARVSLHIAPPTKEPIR